MIRKHATFIAAVAVCNFVFFFPVAFYGRALSPNDVFFHFDPWSDARPSSVLNVQNSLLNDPPTAYFTLMAMAKNGLGTFHWNPYIACGIPGWGSSASAILSPFVILPLFVVSLTWIYTAIVFLKLNLALLFAYLWLREERLGRHGAAIGAIVVAAAGMYSVRWLWQITNATALYPALLWLVRRTFNERRNSIALMALIALGYALAGFPAAMAYGAYVAAIYAVFLAIRLRRVPLGLVNGIAATALALLIAAPSLVPFVQFVRRTGYLPLRAELATQAVYPLRHAKLFLDPDALGNNAYKNWIGDRDLGILNNYVEATIYLGLLTLPLALLGVLATLLERRAPRPPGSLTAGEGARRSNGFFWIALALLILAAMFGFAPFVGRLPGFKYSSLARAGLLLPLPIGYLAALGACFVLRWLKERPRAVAAAAIAAAAAFDLALFAGRFHPYLEPKDAHVPITPTIRFLRNAEPPFRIAPFFNYLWPNTSELFRVEDIRSHFGSEADYRRLMQRLDGTSWGGQSTVLQFNSLNFQFNDPLAGFLGVRWYLEQPSIDIVKWMTIKNTAAVVKETGAIAVKPGMSFERIIRVDAEPFWAIELPASIDTVKGPAPHLAVSLEKFGVTVWSRDFTREDTAPLGKVYIPLRPFARLGESVTLRVRSIGVTGTMLRADDGAFYFARVTTPVVFDRQLPEGRLFRNLAELPRFFPVAKVRKLNRDEFLAARDIDLATEAVITDDPVMPPALGATTPDVTLTHYAPAQQRVTTSSAAPFFLASSEKLTPELRVTIDGRTAKPVQINMLFAGVVVPEGKHEIVYSRQIARGWWGWAIASAVVWLLIAAYDAYRFFATRMI
ncbi:MAG TPA: hypothetical protein VFN10_16205 [Thermoanaerobaculia bacterium]|nr:hypothetical protein [Thermoanaerobaculia bacterium]